MVINKQNDHVILLHIDKKHHYKLKEKYGVNDPQQLMCWQGDDLSADGIFEILKFAGAAVNDVNTIEKKYYPDGSNYESLVEFFRLFKKDLLLDLTDKKIQIANKCNIYAINLMDYLLSATLIDKILVGLLYDDNNEFLDGDNCFVLMIRNVDWAKRSHVFQDIISKKVIKGKILVFDYRGYGVLYNNGILINGEIEIDRKFFYKTLNVSYDSVYKSLIRDTNNYIGHFVLPNSHVRTHYDLTDFIKRDNVSEYIFKQMLDLKGVSESLLLIGVGLEDDAIHRVGDQFCSLLQDKCDIKFVYIPLDASIENRIQIDWLSFYQTIILFGDIVNSGETIKKYLLWIASHMKRNKDVKIFSIIKMLNSPQNIEGLNLNGGLTIQRKFYPKDSLCPLCKMEQPEITVNNIDHFRKIDDRQLTPFDFWEMVGESKALLMNDNDKNTYGIDTIRIFKRYRNWLKSLIKNKYDKYFNNYKANLIVTVEEDGGLLFADLVSDAIGVSETLKISRSDIKKAVPGVKIDIETRIKNDITNFAIIVDDCINSGNTILNLIILCRTHNIVPLGVIIFDSRANYQALQSIAAYIGDNNVHPLYSWA